MRTTEARSFYDNGIALKRRRCFSRGICRRRAKICRPLGGLHPREAKFVALTNGNSPPSKTAPPCNASRSTIEESRFTNHDSRITVHESRFTVHDSRFTVHGSRFTILEPRPARKKLGRAIYARPENSKRGKEGVYCIYFRSTAMKPSTPEPSNRRLLGSGTGEVNHSPLKLTPAGSPPVKKILRKNGSPLVSNSPSGA